MISRAALPARMLFGRSTLANFSSACGFGWRVGLGATTIATATLSAQASGLHEKMRRLFLMSFCTNHFPGSGARVVTLTVPGLGVGAAAGGCGGDFCSGTGTVGACASADSAGHASAPQISTSADALRAIVIR